MMSDVIKIGLAEAAKREADRREAIALEFAVAITANGGENGLSYFNDQELVVEAFDLADAFLAEAKRQREAKP